MILGTKRFDSPNMVVLVYEYIPKQSRWRVVRLFVKCLLLLNLQDTQGKSVEPL